MKPNTLGKSIGLAIKLGVEIYSEPTSLVFDSLSRPSPVSSNHTNLCMVVVVGIVATNVGVRTAPLGD